MDKMHAFRQQQKTIVFVSHAIPQVRDFCDRAMWLEGGRLVKIGDCGEVTEAYSEFIHDFNRLSKQEQKAYKQKIRVRQTGEV